MTATWLALAAIALWATLASLGVALGHVPPFLLTGLALVIGSVPSWPLARQWRVPASTLMSSLGLVKGDDANIERYVTKKALDGLYFMIGEEEKKIRSDPIGTGSALLARVFGR